MIDLHSTLFQIKMESAFVYSPKIFKNKITNRVRTGVVLVAQGEYTYRFGKENTFVAKAGDMVYLPPNPYPYEYKINESLPTRTYQIELHLQESKTAKPFAFSKHPVLIKPSENQSFEPIFDFICKNFSRHDAAAYF